MEEHEIAEIDENVPLDLTRFVPISHDQFFHEMFRDPDFAQAFLKKILKPEAVELLNFTDLEVLPSTFLSEEFRELRADMIYRVPQIHGERPVHIYTLLEHKAQNEFWTIFQVTLYAVQLERRIVEKAKKDGTLTNDFLIPVIIPIIVHHGETQFTGLVRSIELREKFAGYEKYGACVEAILTDLSVIPDEELPSDPNVPELNAAMRLMKYIFHKDFKAKFIEILERIHAHVTAPKYQRINTLMWYYAYSRAKYVTPSDLRDVAKQIPNPTKEENEMSSVMEQLLAEGFEKGISQGINQGISQGINQGISQGIDLGIDKGKVESILLLLSSIGHVSQELVERIQKIAPSRLNDLILLARKCDSLEEFEKAL